MITNHCAIGIGMKKDFTVMESDRKVEMFYQMFAPSLAVLNIKMDSKITGLVSLQRQDS